MKQLKVEYVELQSLRAYENNSRTHPESQVEQICNSIREFGFVNPILVDDGNTIIAGHGRFMAAQKLALETVPVVRVSGLSQRQIKALVIADNKIAANAFWDFNMLSNELSDLVGEEFDIDILGFNEQEIDALLKDDVSILPPEPDSIPAPTASAPQGEARKELPEGNFNDPGISYKQQYGVIVMCENEQSQAEIFERLSDEGFKCKIVVT